MKTEKTQEEQRLYDKYIPFINGSKKINDWVVMMFNYDLSVLKRCTSNIIIFFMSIFMFFMSCSSIEERIKDDNYTDLWYYHNNKRYQVYKTDKDNYYIVVLNKKETRMVRKYVEKP